MTDGVGDRADPDRLRLLRSVFEPSTLDEVAQAVAVATENEHRVYVERVGTSYRWSLTHPGGGYPLLRIAARFLKVDHTRIMVAFRTVEDGVCVLCRDPEESPRADRWTIIDFDGPSSPEVVSRRIDEAFGAMQ